MPTTEYLFATLAGGKSFSELDLSQAYQHVLLDQGSRKYVTINTHKGLYHYSRLPFGIGSSTISANMEMVLQVFQGWWFTWMIF